MVKVLVCGDAKGRFNEMFGAAQRANSKAGPFEALFCVGQFFGDGTDLEDYLTGTKSVPLPTYFICGREPDRSTTAIDSIAQDGGELCTNLTYLGRQGRKQIAGLQVCYLSGIYDKSVYESEMRTTSRYEPTYREEDVEELLVEGFAYNAAKGVDVLLTAEWGEGFYHLLPKQANKSEKWGGRAHPLKSFKQLSPAVQRMCSEAAGGVKAQYHFAGTEGFYFALPPYAHAPPPIDAEKTEELGAASGANVTPPSLVTRFYGMGFVGEKAGGKNLMALNVKPPPPPGASMGLKKAAKEAAEQMAKSATANPYTPASAQKSEAASRLAAAATGFSLAEKMREKKRLEELAKNGGLSAAAGEGAGKGEGQGGAGEKDGKLELKLECDPVHFQMDGGDWECGYCGNVNQARRKQVWKCNMRSCGKDHYLNAPQGGGGAADGVRGPTLPTAFGRGGGYAAVGGGGEEGQSAAARYFADRPGGQKERPKTQKRVSLYADQGGGLSNPKKSKQRKSNYGTNNDGSNNRVKW